MNDGRLVAINADTGERCTDFGKNGEVDLQKDMPFPYPGGYIPTSPPVVTGTTIIIAGSTTDNYSTEEPSGVIRVVMMYNTGALLWVFDTGAEVQCDSSSRSRSMFKTHRMHGQPLAYDASLGYGLHSNRVSVRQIFGAVTVPSWHERYATQCWH